MSLINMKSSLSLEDRYTKHPTNIVERKLDDIKRVTNFMYGSPEGALFIGKQVGLQLMNPKQEENGSKFLSPDSTSANRIYNLGANTLAQVAVQGTGFHLDRHGLLPVNEEKNKYYKVVAENDKYGKSKLILLNERLMYPTSNSIYKDEFRENTNEETIISKYNGGPGSFLGIGQTTITRTVNTTAKNLRQRDDLNDSAFQYPNANGSKTAKINYYHQLNLSTKQFTTNQLKEATGIDPDRPYVKPEYVDQPRLATIIGKPMFRAYDETTLTYQNNPGQYVKPAGATVMKESGIEYIDKRVNFQASDGTQFVDGVNLVNIYTSDERAKDEEGYAAAERDLVKLKFELINNDNPNKTDHLVFRSYITTFEDSSSAQWNEINYLGRGDSFYVYNKYTGTYSFGFDIMASSSGEMKPIYNKLNYLKSSLAPDYNGTRMRGSLIRLTVGNYLVRVPGFISALNISIPEDAPWDIDITSGETGSFAKELPRYLKVSVQFTPIYNHLVRKGRTTPFISVDKLGYLE